MKIQCIQNHVDDNLKDHLNPLAGFREGFKFDLTVGSEYVVYGIAFRSATLWYYLCGDLHTHYPIAYPASIFKVTDPHLSRYWIFGFTAENLDHQALITFSEWVTNPYFYDHLTDLDDNTVAIFQRVKRLMDDEFA
jgi:hypothetical protein